MNTIPFQIDDETIIYIEAEEEYESGIRHASRRGGKDEEEEKTTHRFEKAIAAVKPAAEMLLDAFREMNTPDEISMEFNVKFSGKLGVAVLASAKSEAAFKVGLKWTKPKKGA